jgi:hypothetical protein
MSVGIVLISEPLLIPIWFYSYSAVVYFLAAIISFITSFFAFKLYKVSSVKLNLFLLFSFLALGLAFSALTLTSVYTYFYKPYFETFYSLSKMNKMGFNFYYLTSLVAYVLFLVMYLPKKFSKRFFVLYIPLYYINLTNFHIISILLLLFVVIKNIANFYKKRNLDSFLVMFAFITMISFHSLLLLTPFDVELYLLAHVIITVGFASFLTMLIRVSRR